MPAPNVIRLRALLSERFSGLRLHIGEPPASKNKFQPSGVAAIDQALQGGLPKGGLTEIVSPGKSSGGATLIHELLRQAAEENQITALIDGNDSLDVTQLDEGILSRLLWVRSRSVEEALKAADFILRDSNMSLVLLDLKFNSEREIRKIPPTTWYRFQRIVEESGLSCVVFTARAMVSSAQTRITLQSHFPLEALDRDTAELLPELKLEISDARQFQETARQSVA